MCKLVCVLFIIFLCVTERHAVAVTEESPMTKTLRVYKKLYTDGDYVLGGRAVATSAEGQEGLIMRVKRRTRM